MTIVLICQLCYDSAMAEYFKEETLDALSSLIGLSRSLEGDGNPLDDTVSLIYKAVKEIADDEVEPGLKTALMEKKKETVPSCFVCPSPCGHNDDYPMDRINSLDNPLTKDMLKTLKRIILSDIDYKTKRENVLKGIIYISSDFEREYIEKYLSVLKGLL